MIKDFLLAIFALTLLVYVIPAHAKPIATATQGAVVVTFTDEPCTLSEQIKGLPGRATWTEKGVVTEACYTLAGPLLMIYYADKTLGLVPKADLQPVADI